MDPIPEPIAGLIRDHRAIEAVVGRASASVSAAAEDPADDALVTDALTDLYILKDFLEREVATHIEKEERVLFPVLRQAVVETSQIVDDMIAEHDMVRERRDLLRQTLTTLDDDHDQVSEAETRLNAELDAIPVDGMTATLARLRKTVLELDWILQGHFTGEEDGLFVPAEALLSPSILDGLARRMAEIDASAAAGGVPGT